MRLATWNINSLNARMERLEEWLAYAQPDVLCLQETKCADDKFPALAIQGLGYDAAHHGTGGRNGVAILSRVGLDDVVTGFDDGVEEDAIEARAITATCGDIRTTSVYVPNGQRVGSEQYDFKLSWLDRLRKFLDSTASPEDAVAVMGDFNVAPADADVWSPKAFEGQTHVSEPERDRFRALLDWGLTDSFRVVHPEDRLYSWWDYRAGNFHKHKGMRIDHLLVSAPVAQRVEWALIDRTARKGKQPSDHAPVFIDLAD